MPEASCLHQVGFHLVNTTPQLASVATGFIARPEESDEVGLMALVRGAVTLRGKRGRLRNTSGGVLLASVMVDEMEVHGSRRAMRLSGAALAIRSVIAAI